MPDDVDSTICDLEDLGVFVVISVHQNNKCISLLDSMITSYNPKLLPNSQELHTALLHECGHFISGAFYYPCSDYTVAAQAEYKANKAAILKYVPEDEIFVCVANGITELWELAEHFCVTEEFMSMAMFFYSERKTEKVVRGRL